MGPGLSEGWDRELGKNSSMDAIEVSSAASAVIETSLSAISTSSREELAAFSGWVGLGGGVVMSEASGRVFALISVGEGFGGQLFASLLEISSTLRSRSSIFLTSSTIIGL